MTYLMLVHVVCGTLAVIAGLVAMCAPKGRSLHINAGRVYLVTMLAMATSGGLTAILLPQAINVYAACLTSYLVVTSWHAGKNKQLGRNKFELLACLFICIIAFLTLKTGVDVMNSEQKHLQGFSYDAFFVIGSMAFVAAVADIVLLIRGGVQGKHRIIRHLWRMCLSYFIAAGSLFEGPGASAFPEVIRDSGVLSVPVPLVVLFTLYWLVRTMLPKLRLSFSHS